MLVGPQNFPELSGQLYQQSAKLVMLVAAMELQMQLAFLETRVSQELEFGNTLVGLVWVRIALISILSILFTLSVECFPSASKQKFIALV